jgi:hypothetical protein
MGKNSQNEFESEGARTRSHVTAVDMMFVPCLSERQIRNLIGSLQHHVTAFFCIIDHKVESQISLKSMLVEQQFSVSYRENGIDHSRINKYSL